MPMPEDREWRVDEAIAAYLQACESGAPPDRETFLAAHAELRDELASFLDNRELLTRLSPPTAAEAPPAGSPGGAGHVGDYEVLAEVGRGGMGVVYKALQKGLKRVVALKVILAGEGLRTEDVERFRHEAHVVAGMDHPGIVPIYEVGAYNGLPFFTMKLVEGGSLAEHRERFRAPRDAARLVAKVARAVQHAHLRGVLHRDLKPGNVLLGDGDEPLVTDFGLAKRLEGDAGLTRSGAIVGTANYMAPEQAAGEGCGLTTAADVHALGAILYELLTGRPPFVAGNMLDTLLRVRQEKAAPVRPVNAAVDRDLETICLKCLEKEPERRYGGAAALAEDLERWLRGEPIAARTAGGWEQLWRWVRRNPAVAGLTAAVMVLLVVGTTVATGLALWATGEAQKAREEATRADRERDTARDQAYRADTFSHSNLLELAVRALVDDGDMQRAAELLRRCPEGMRTTWEHRSVQGLYHRLASPLTLKGDTSELSGMAFSPDGSRIATAIARHDPKTKKWQGEVKVWDAQTGQPKLNLVGPIGPCRDLAFSPDGTRIVAHNTGDFGNTHEVKVWDVRTGRQLHSLAGALGPVAFSPDGKRLASSSPDNWLKGWDIETGKEDLWFLSGHTKGVGHIAYSPDGKRLASVSSDATLKVWDPQTGRELHSLTGASGPLAFSPDGKRLASSSPVNWVKVWDTETGRELRVFKGHSDPVGTLAFNYDGSRLASGGHDKSVRVWACENAGPFPETLTLWGHTGPVTAVWYSPDRKRLVSGGGTVKAWDAWTGRAVPMVKWAPWGSGREARSPDGTRAASWDGNTVRLWNLGEDLELSTFTRQVGSEATSLAFSPDGMQVASGYPLRVWGLRTGREMLFQREGDRVCAVAYSPDGTRIASGDAGGGLVVWDARNGQRKLAWGGHNNIVTSVAYSPDGTRIASGSGVFDGNHFIAGEVKVWDALTGQLKHTLKGHVGLVNDLAYSPDGAHIAATERSSSHRGELNVWGSASGQKVFTLNNQVGAFHGLAYSPDGTRIASGRAVWDKAQYKYISCEVKVYDAVTGEEKQALRGHTGRVLSVAYSPDGTRIASGGEDRVIKIWDARTGHEKLTLEGHVQPVTKVAFSPDGRLLASADRDGTVKLWDAP